MAITHLKGLKLVLDPRGIATALDVTGTSVITGDITITGDIVQTGDQVVTGSVAADELRTTDFNMASAANASCGVKTIGAGSSGAGVIASTKIVATSRIFLTAAAGDAYPLCGIRAIGTGTASFFLKQFSATAATASGKIFWQIINL